MIKILTIIFIFNTLLFANKEVYNNIIKNYEPKKMSNIELSEEQLNQLCGEKHFSTECEIISLSIDNETTKKRIVYILEEITKKYKLDEKLAINLNTKFMNYIEENQKIDNIVSFCNSSLCSLKSIQSGLESFESALKFVLNNKIIKSDNKELSSYFSLNDIDNLYLDNYNFIVNTKKGAEIEKPLIFKNDFLQIEKLWNQYELSLKKFLEKTSKFDLEWIRVFYEIKYNYSIRLKEYFQEINSQNKSNEIYERYAILELEKYSKNNKFFDNIDNNDLNHNLEKKYNLSENEVLLLYSSYNKFNCHICVPKMSWFYLKNENNKWKIKKSIINKETQLGTWGSFVVPRLIKPKKDLFVFKYDFTYVNQGFSEDFVTLELFNNGKFEEIFHNEFGLNDAGAYDTIKNDWGSRIDFVNSKNEIPNLLIEKIGLKNSRIFYDKKIYIFNKGKYKLIKEKGKI
ncbi:hypothetical protein [Arcobacter defluvii]|jgi:hypothetical protein|uniref:Uncharacterized protein n=1 Tax=Arcobacter defluvii TaxID=873191 RepID=A0AAE7E5I0_9BACT|nr:hypothetical protein [Arcobacter defluvii]QKF76357.1 hypothetical protein ADFLV_0294 [Arcobacter defluvii]RXI29471.1 hypothetical protein CP964_13835 [Arcobacter defluvii]